MAQEFSSVSVQQALLRGHLVLNTPAILLFVVPLVADILLASFDKAPSLSLVYVIVWMIVVPWLYWSFAVVRWKLWAFSRVREVHELWERAVREKLIWPAGSRWEKTEIWYEDQRNKWTAIQRKFSMENTGVDSPDIPVETLVHYAEPWSSIPFFLFALAGAWLLIGGETDAQHVVGALSLLGFTWLAIGQLRKGLDRQVQLRISAEGIETPATGFLPWTEIRNAYIQPGPGSGTHVLHLQTTDNAYTVEITEFGIKPYVLSNLVKVYRRRSGTKEQAGMR